MQSLVDYSDDEQNNQVSIINRIHLQGTFPSFIKIDVTNYLFHLKQSQNYHISLCLNFRLNYHQIKEFYDQLQNEIEIFESFNCTLEKESQIFKNQITNKQYFVLLINQNKEKVKQLIKIIDIQIKLFDSDYQTIDIIPHCTIKNHPTKIEKDIIIKIKEIIIEIGKQKKIIKLI